MYEIIRKQLEKIDIKEVTAVKLLECEAEKFFNEAKDRGKNLLKLFDNFNSIDGNLYLIYWGKRPYGHLDNPKGIDSIRLSTYDSLKNKTIHTVVIVNDHD